MTDNAFIPGLDASGVIGTHVLCAPTERGDAVIAVSWRTNESPSFQQQH